MGSVNANRPWTAADSAELYCVKGWGDGLFQLSDGGDMQVCPEGPGSSPVGLSELVSRARTEHQARLPMLLSFPQIALNRAAQLRTAFEQQIASSGYQGRYTPVFPIKVNQQRSLVSALTGEGGLGLETGSKAELLAALAVTSGDALIICNGYKDRDYLALALLGQRLGRRVTIVLESLGELPLIAELCGKTGQTPCLGVRLKLASVAGGHWQNSGGERSKFGLGPAQVDQLLSQLTAAGQLHWLTMVHFHMGSQISNIRDIRQAMDELGRYLVELAQRDVSITQIDVGGGLGVDYEGAGSRGYFSMNYGMAHYAAAVVSAVAQTCRAAGISDPDIITEAGRALSAHHAVLVTEVLRTERPAGADQDPGTQPFSEAESEFERALVQLADSLAEGPASERFSEAQHFFDSGKAAFAQGAMDLAGRGGLERAFFAVCRAIYSELDLTNRRTGGLADELSTLLARRCFCNVSVFRSIPDAWAIDQVFPIAPLSGLDRQPQLPSVLHDLTCDSDGQIFRYVTGRGIDPTLPLSAENAEKGALLGIFMVGAYQDILGDNHNLLGRTQVCEVTHSDGQTRLLLRSAGDTAGSVLSEVGYHRAWLQDRFASIAGQDPQGLAMLNAGLDSYTYLED